MLVSHVVNQFGKEGYNERNTDIPTNIKLY